MSPCPSSILIIYHNELYRLVLAILRAILRFKYLGHGDRSGNGISFNKLVSTALFEPCKNVEELLAWLYLYEAYSPMIFTKL
ncbi:MAG: hypothetical protein ACTS73_08490 [Arsenophonus sp. NEOnobi-MAG3]